MDHQSPALSEAQCLKEAVEGAFFLVTPNEPPGAMLGFGRPHANHGPNSRHHNPADGGEAAVGLGSASPEIEHPENS
jgi:hypothetical protein